MLCVYSTCVCFREQEQKPTLTFWSVDKQPLKALVCADFYGPIGGLAQDGGSDSAKKKKKK